jgi:IMP dehydrogenase/GMP reductase
VKVGIGPGSICTTRIVAGVGVPQLTAIAEAVRAAGKRRAGDRRRRHQIFGRSGQGHRRRRQVAMMGSMFAGTEEAPGEVFLYQGRSYKIYRGMGSVGAMARGSADRYFQKEVTDAFKLVPEGIEGQTPSRAPVGPVMHQLVGGLRAAMGYVGAPRSPSSRTGALRAHHRRGPAREPRPRRDDHAGSAELSERGLEHAESAVELQLKLACRGVIVGWSTCCGRMPSPRTAAGSEVERRVTRDEPVVLIGHGASPRTRLRQFSRDLPAVRRRRDRHLSVGPEGSGR